MELNGVLVVLDQQCADVGTEAWERESYQRQAALCGGRGAVSDYTLLLRGNANKDGDF